MTLRTASSPVPAANKARVSTIINCRTQACSVKAAQAWINYAMGGDSRQFPKQSLAVKPKALRKNGSTSSLLHTTTQRENGPPLLERAFRKL